MKGQSEVSGNAGWSASILAASVPGDSKDGSSKAPTDPPRDHYSHVDLRFKLKDMMAPILDYQFENGPENKQQQRVICLFVNIQYRDTIV